MNLHQHQAHSDHDEDQPKISSQAIKNLGLEFVDARLTSFSTYRSIPAIVAVTPLTVQPLFAPIAGVIKEIQAIHGAVVTNDYLLVTLLRDAIARPSLTLTANLFDPENRFKGLTVTQIASLEDMSPAKKQIALWQLALKRNGYWSGVTESTYHLLPKEIAALPLSAAVLGELTANGYLTKKLSDWFKDDIGVGEHFFDIASLLLQGKGLSYVQNLYQLGALNETVFIKSPVTEKDWDVHGIFVKPAEHVDVGAKLIELHNARELHLQVHARGSEIEILVKALEANIFMSAESLIKGAAPTLTRLKIRNIQDDTDGKGGAVLHLEVTGNKSIMNKHYSGAMFRSWLVRAGAKYMLRVPQEIYKNVYVVKNSAVVSSGPDKIVYIQDGDYYRAINVVVIYSDHEFAVLSKDSELDEYDTIVTTGAYGLDIALKAGSAGAVDLHAGHSH